MEICRINFIIMSKVIYSLFTLLIVATFISCKKIKFNYSSEAKPVSHVSGSGNITLVLEAGMGNWSLFYRNLVPLLSSKYKVITIDRAGYDNGLVPDNSRDATVIAGELHTMLLDQNLTTDSVILIGHSFGGSVVRMYQNLFPQKIVGMVLLDACHEDQFKRLPCQFEQLKQEQIDGMKKTIKTAQKGLLKTNYGRKKIPTFNLPSEMLDDYYSITVNPQYYATFEKEVSSFDVSLSQIKALPKLGNLPLLVLASEKSMDETTLSGAKNYPYSVHNQKWLTLQNELAQLSTNSTFASSALSNHYLAVFESQWVADQINAFVETKVK